MKDNKRIVFLDLLRVAAFILVFFYHFLVRIAENGIVEQETVQSIYEYPNFHIATLGVSLFFMISGAGLMMSANKKWDLKEYFQRRVVRILLPFYIAYTGIFAGMFLLKDGQIFESGIPKWHFIFTIAGVDGYFSELGISTFSLGVGEWFLGCLIIMYVIFPLLRKLMCDYQKVFIIAAGMLYVLVVSLDSSGLPIHMNFGAKLFEFIFGMFLVQHWDKLSKKSLIISVPVLILFLLCPFSFPLKDGVKITVLAAAVIIFMAQFESLLNRGKKIRDVVGFWGKYSFEMYLIHHWIIIVLTQYMAKRIQNPIGLVVLFITELLLTLIGAAIIKRIAQIILFCYNKFLKI